MIGMSSSPFKFKSQRKDPDGYKSSFQRADQLGVLLGARLVSLTETEVIYEYSVKSEHFNPNGILHGGALFSVMDSSQGALMHYVLADEFSRTVSGTATIRYEAPVSAGSVSIRTTLNRREGRKYFVDSVACQEAKVVARLEEVWIAIV
jgi:acyl-CoA thioesterase